jgi:hypothetical protein
LSADPIHNRKALASRLADGWEPASEEDHNTVIAAVAEAVLGTVVFHRFESGPKIAILDLSHIRLYSMDEVPCLLLCSGAHLSQDIQEFCQQIPLGRLGIILALTNHALMESKKLAMPRQFMPVSLSQICELLTAVDGREVFGKMLVSFFGRLALVPFNLLRPVDPHMFFGRRFDLTKLLVQPNVSFAMSGPEGLGKTSLLRQYERELIRSKDPRVVSRFYINFLSCENMSETEIARYLAIRIDGRKSSNELQGDPKEIVRFFRRLKTRLDGRVLDLLLDDVDEVCGSAVFQALGDCARQAICRLVFAGRSGLLELLMDKSSDLKGRLAMMRLEPLDDESAAILLLGPLRDLGWPVEQPDEFCARLMGLTGRLPHLLQFCGKKICELAIQKNLRSIDLPLIDEIRWDFEMVNMITSALTGIKNKQLRTIALLLLESHPQHVTAGTVQRLAADAGIELERDAAEDACKRLVLESVLSWHKGDYRLASEALPEYAKRQGLFGQLRQSVSVS